MSDRILIIILTMFNNVANCHVNLHLNLFHSCSLILSLSFSPTHVFHILHNNNRTSKSKEEKQQNPFHVSETITLLSFILYYYYYCWRCCCWSASYCFQPIFIVQIFFLVQQHEWINKCGAKKKGKLQLVPLSVHYVFFFNSLSLSASFFVFASNDSVSIS